MKRPIVLIVIVAVALALSGSFSGCSWSSEFVSTVHEKLSPVIEKGKELLPATEAGEGEAAESEWLEGLSLPSLDADTLDVIFQKGVSLGAITVGPGKLSSVDDVVLVPTDDYAQGYVFYYDGEEFTAYFDSYSWRVYNSYKITNHNDIVMICQALLNEHPVYGSDWASYRTADDMAFEWEQHNLAYKVLPEDSQWIDDAKDVDLDPDDQGKTIQELYESRTGQKFDIRNYL